jgi:glutamine cyclotransferase
MHGNVSKDAIVINNPKTERLKLLQPLVDLKKKSLNYLDTDVLNGIAYNPKQKNHFL